MVLHFNALKYHTKTMWKQSSKRADVRAPLITSSTAEEIAAWEERGPALLSPWVYLSKGVRHRILVMWINLQDNRLPEICEVFCMYSYATPINFSIWQRKCIVYHIIIKNFLSLSTNLVNHTLIKRPLSLTPETHFMGFVTHHVNTKQKF